VVKRGEKELLNCTPVTDYWLQADLWTRFVSLSGKRNAAWKGEDAQAALVLPLPMFGALDMGTFNVQLA